MAVLDDLTVLKCHYCNGGQWDGWCANCHRTGSIFWVSGRSYPYSPDGEKMAKRARSIDNRSNDDGKKTPPVA